MWYALNNEKAEYKYSFDYQNWYPSVEFETKNTITNVGLYELSPFSKYEIKGEKHTVNYKEYVQQILKMK